MSTPSPAGRKAVVLILVVAVIAVAVVLVALGGGHDAATTAALDHLQQTSAELEHLPHERPLPPSGVQGEGVSADFYATAWEQFEPVHTRNDNIETALDTAFAVVWLEEPGEVTTLAPACETLSAPAAVRPHMVGLAEDVCVALREVQPTLAVLYEGTRQRRNASPFHPWNSWMYLGGGRSREASVFRELATLALVDARLHPVAESIERLVGLLRFAADLHEGGTVLGAVTGASLRIRATGALRQLLGEPLSEGELQALVEGLAHVRRHRTELRAPFEAEYVVVMNAWARWIGADVGVVPGALPVPAEHLEEREVALALADRSTLWRRLIEVQGQPLARRLSVYAELTGEVQEGTHALDTILARYQWAEYDRLVTQSVAHVDLVALAAADQLHHRRKGAWAVRVEQLRDVAPDLVVEDPLTGRLYGLEEIDGERVIYSEAVRKEVSERLGLGDVAASRLAISSGHP